MNWRPGNPDPKMRAIRDRIRTAVRTLKAARVPVDPHIVLTGAGLDMHRDRKRLLPMIRAITEDLDA